MSALLSSDLLDYSTFIYSYLEIPLEEVSTRVRGHVQGGGSRSHGGRESQGNMGGKEGITVHPTTPPPHTSFDPTPHPQPTLIHLTLESPRHTSLPPVTFTHPSQGHGHYTSI